MSDTKRPEVIEDADQASDTTPNRRRALGTSAGAEPSNFTGWMRSARARGIGDLGAAPVLVGLIIIWAVLQSLSSTFLGAENLVNLALQSAANGTIALGVVLVLIVGQIDLSIGSMSGVAAAVLAIGFTQENWPLGVAIVAALAAGAVVGAVYGVLFTRFGVPTFVITLAGLLALLGVQLQILGGQGSINLPFESWLVRFATKMFVPEWLSYGLAVAAAAAYFLSRLQLARRRRAAGLSSRLMSVLVARTVLVLAALIFSIWYLNTERGVGVMFVVFIALVIVVNYLLTRTSWGRSIFAVGGNVEAARRAGINVNRVYITVFMAGTTLAALGGVLAAARLAAASQSSGAGDVNLTAIAAAVIGGTSLYGGRGSAWSALLGILVISSISSGLNLLNLDASVRYMVTGAVLLLAVIVDSLSRRSRAVHGQA